MSLAGGQAAFTTSALAQGTHPITAVYSGDPNNQTSTSPVVNQIVGVIAAQPPTAEIPTLGWEAMLALSALVAVLGAMGARRARRR